MTISTDKLEQGTSQQDILDHYLIVTTVNKNFLKIFDIWFHFFKNSPYVSILRVITFDNKSEKYVSSKRIETIYPGKSTTSFAKLIQWRFEVIEKLIQEGKNIIHTDADAFWIRPNIESLINKRFDIQCSIGYGIPRISVERWGFSLCTGFMILQSNDAVKRFMKHWIKEIKLVMDDQVAFNNLILRNNPRWELESVVKNYCVCSEDQIFLEAINNNCVSRQGKSETLVFHPYLKSNHQLMKIGALRDKFKKSMLLSSDIDQCIFKILFSPINWIYSTLGFLNVVFHKTIKKLKVKDDWS